MELQQTDGDTASQQCRCVAHTPFPHHIPPMMFDRAWANSISRRDLFIGKTAPNTLKDFAFPYSQFPSHLPTFIQVPKVVAAYCRRERRRKDRIMTIPRTSLPRPLDTSFATPTVARDAAS